MGLIRITATLIMLLIACAAFAQEEEKDYSELSGRVIENIIIEADDVFDTATDEENNWLFDLANQLHINTRTETLNSQLLFESGDEFSQQKLAESERILRNNAYLFDASITPIKNQNGAVDVLVKTKDNWTLFPEFTFSSTGGESESSFGIEEQNFLGTGTRLNVRRENDKDRTSSVFEFSGSNLGSHRLSLAYGFSDLSDGESQLIRVQRPFFSLDTTWAAGATVFVDDRIESLYSFGEKGARYRKDQKFTSGFLGQSTGLQNDWAKRWILGYVTDDRDFDPVVDEGLAEITPESRTLHYPFLRYQQLQDSFAETTNLNQIGRTEDISLGARYEFTLGYASEGFGSDRNAWILGAKYGRGYGSPDSTLILVDSSFSSRVESGALRNALLESKTELYRRQSEKRVAFASAALRIGKNLDLDNYESLGGEAGLRGYPLNYFNAESSILVTLEQRFYTDYYPFRLYRVGAAVFVDAARGWGQDPIGMDDNEVLANVGFGLRFGSMRSGNNRIFHLDVAFPISGDSDLDSVQFQIIGKRSF